jgi:hypothetical protein
MYGYRISVLQPQMDLARCCWLQAGGTALVANVLQRAGVRERLADALCADLGLGEF